MEKKGVVQEEILVMALQGKMAGDAGWWIGMGSEVRAELEQYGERDAHGGDTGVLGAKRRTLIA